MYSIIFVVDGVSGSTECTYNDLQKEMDGLIKAGYIVTDIIKL